MNHFFLRIYLHLKYDQPSVSLVGALTFCMELPSYDLWWFQNTVQLCELICIAYHHPISTR
jgi:hypothetical protein